MSLNVKHVLIPLMCGIALFWYIPAAGQQAQDTSSQTANPAPPAPVSQTADSPQAKKQKKKKESKSSVLFWNPPNVDAHLSTNSASNECVLSTVLGQAGGRALELLANLQNFTAQEDIEYRSLGNAYEQDSDAGSFDYTASFDRTKKGYVVQEALRPEQGSHDFPAATQDVGLPNMALIFLPHLQSNYEMKCEGPTAWKGQAAWVVRFKQHVDQPNHNVSFAGYPVLLKGRAWIAQDSGDLMHLELGLMREIPEVNVKGWFLSIDYAPVSFRTGNSRIWLPQSVDAYGDFAVRRTITSHKFSNFMLFSVQTDEKIGSPNQAQL